MNTFTPPPRKNKRLSALWVSALLALPMYASAQGHNSAEHHRQWNPQHSGYDGGGSSYQGRIIHIPNQEWINYHGALAWNETSARGVSQNARSERAARKEALDKCNAVSNGANDCKIAAFTTNGCLASAIDDNSTTVGAAPTKEAAEARAMRHCQANGSTSCRVTYSHCNHPVRIR